MKLEDLVKTINSRADADPSESWTAKLLAQGPEKCAEKFGEEAVEAIIEAVKGDNNALISEAADVIFQYLVMLKSREINFDDVMKELKIRTNKSGLREKEERPEGEGEGEGEGGGILFRRSHGGAVAPRRRET